MSKVERMDAELRDRFQAELPQIRDWLNDFHRRELQVAPEFECSILQAERDPVVGLSGRVPIGKPVSLWANVDGGSFDANSESAFELQRQGRPIVKAPVSSEDWSYQIQGGIEFQLTRWYGPSQAGGISNTILFRQVLPIRPHEMNPSFKAE